MDREKKLSSHRDWVIPLARNRKPFQRLDLPLSGQQPTQRAASSLAPIHKPHFATEGPRNLSQMSNYQTNPWTQTQLQNQYLVAK